MFVSPVQSWNALLPMVSTEEGIVMLVSPVQPLNAFLPMLLTPSGITLFLQPRINVPESFSIRQLPSPLYLVLPLATEMDVRALQPAPLELLALSALHIRPALFHLLPQS